ncbi:MAG: grasp-with-spasm system ATP-grasp peptide maturase [Vicingaceae bacterium]|nr:grasp-with-spasm system ATP-grasp peptide maturase [Vicingaceae bacterium]
MILIVSNNKEKSTSDVIEWLLYYGVEFELISKTKPITINYSNRNGIEIKTSNRKTINFKDVKSFWYRRGKFYAANKIYQDVTNYIVNHELEEWNKINELLMLFLKAKKGIGSYFVNDINKNYVLHIASTVGLKTPKTLITNSKKDVIAFFGKERIINKTIADVMSLKENNKFYTNKTIEIKAKLLSTNFYPSLFQELLEKKYELRVFYLKGMFYSCAIFSQSNEKTMIDFRNYDYQKPNRYVPFSLPVEIKKKLELLMKKIKLDTGSIDIIVTPANEFYFLEVNPVGQFGMVSTTCNYYLEKVIAETLMN